MVGDLVSIRSPKLGTLTNRVNHCDKIAPWTFGISALMRNLAARGCSSDSVFFGLSPRRRKAERDAFVPSPPLSLRERNDES